MTSPEPLFDRIRARCAEVTRRAGSVRIDGEGLERLADELAAGPAEPEGPDPARKLHGDPDQTLAFILTLNAINFGSGWFPFLRKRPGCSGYLTVAGALEDHFAKHGAWSPGELSGLAAADVAEVLGQTLEPPVGELMELFARALRDLGDFLTAGWQGSFAGPVAEAGGSAERLVGLLDRMPLYRDVARYDELEVPFYKRAQITASDLALAFAEEGPGRFEDLDRLTLFADNLVPHVLRMEGVLRYAPALMQRIDREETLAPGCREEVEIRAVALHAVEELVAACARRGLATHAHRLDHRLWDRGQSPRIKAVPRHRTRCTFY